MASSADTGTYLLIVTIGFVMTLIVGQILMRSGVGFLRDVFDDHDVAQSMTRLLGVVFHLVALGFMALLSTWDPFDVTDTVQLVITQVGGVMLLLGILHGLTLLRWPASGTTAPQRMAASLRSGSARAAGRSGIRRRSSSPADPPGRPAGWGRPGSTDRPDRVISRRSANPRCDLRDVRM